MKKSSILLSAIAILTLLLAGCGSATRSENNTTGDGSTKTPATEDTEQKDENPAKTENDNGTDNKEESEDGLVRILEQNLQYEVNGETKEETAFLKYNDNQDYSMYVLPDYELTAEEPYKDVLFLTSDPQVFMRVELLPEDVDWATVSDTTKAQLQAVNETVNKVQPPDDDFFNNSEAMEASNNNETVTAYLFKDTKLPLKLTMFTKEDADNRDAFLEMAKTIMRENKQK